MEASGAKNQRYLPAPFVLYFLWGNDPHTQVVGTWFTCQPVTPNSNDPFSFEVGIDADGGAEDAARNRVKCGWAKFHDLGCVLKGRGASWNTKGKFYRSCVQKTLLHGTETWPAKMEDIQRLERAEKSMVRWMCGVSLKKGCRSEDLLQRLGVENIASVMKRGRLRWYGHVERKPDNDWTSKCRYVEVEGKRRKGRPKMTFDARVKQDMDVFGLTKEMAQDRDLWRGFYSGKPSNPSIARKSGHYKRKS